MAFAITGGISGTDPRKTLLAALLGLMLGTLGLDPATGVARYTFGSFNLYNGFDPIVALVGLIANSEILFFLEQKAQDRQLIPKGSVFPHMSRVKEGLDASLCGSMIGFIAGILPGAGASLGAVMAYSFEKRLNDKGSFGTGDPRGVAAPEAGNSAASGGALIPMLTLGGPGSGTTAVMLAMLISLNIQPGPLLF